MQLGHPRVYLLKCYRSVTAVRAKPKPLFYIGTSRGGLGRPVLTLVKGELGWVISGQSAGTIIEDSIPPALLVKIL